MSEVYERFTDGLFEGRWQPGEPAEFHRRENKQRHRAEEQKSEADKMKQIVIELTNVPVLVLEMPAEKPNPKNLDIQISFLDIVEIILKMIVDGAKAIFPKRETT